ncbi:MAG: helix-turn-helix transcriptional regulator [Lachnospiraceae bacterium]|nr:helix-turn-helix transcriptional regulator [Lachnospiraceae bacterium]
MVIAKDRKLLGVIHFYRTIGKENFQSNDIFILDMLKDHLTYRIDRHKAGGIDDQKKLTVTEAVEQYALTRRENTILRMLMQGLESNIICDQLSISANTLKKHILNIYRKLGIRNRVQLFKKIRERED